MLSTKMVELIESNWEEIANRVVRAVKKHPDLQNLARCSDLELRDWCREMLQNLGYLLSATKDFEVQRRFEVLGKARFEDHIPLHEAVLRMQLLKDKVIGFVHEQGFPMSAMQLYAEEELEFRLSRLFDAGVYRIVRGYESAISVEQRLQRHA
jgi:hypothetical protein